MSRRVLLAERLVEQLFVWGLAEAYLFWGWELEAHFFFCWAFEGGILNGSGTQASQPVVLSLFVASLDPSFFYFLGIFFLTFLPLHFNNSLLGF